ncbi:MAG: NADH:ubiquinone oxidoreductase subunit NDUFA12 [Hyphomicrobiales bacterium]
MMRFLTEFFTWWNGQTMGTRFFTWRKGERVGEDEFGNVYYRAPSKIPSSIAERRWVIYNGLAEPSAIPAGWHGWIHHRTDETPVDEAYTPHEWEKPHQKNLTGTAGAYRPVGSLFNPNPAPAKKDYEAWSPE